jgi:hypothetical protein
VSSRDRELRPGDEVEVVIPGVVADDGTLWSNGRRVWASPEHVQAYGGRVVVTLPVDHPSRDPVGTVRGNLDDVWVKVDKYGDAAENFEPPYEGYSGIWWNVMDGEERVGDDVEEWPVIGVVPNTPAERAQKGAEST